jgi:hypothetical protein
MSDAALHRLELEVLELLVAGSDPVLEVLREQLAASRVARRERTEVGFFTFLDVPSWARRLADADEFVLDDVAATLSGVARPARFLLAVHDGVLHFVEGVIVGERWPDEPRLERAYFIRRGSAGGDVIFECRERDLAALRARWEA